MLREFLDTARDRITGRGFSPESRPLRATEVLRARKLFADALRYDRVVLTRDSILTLVSPNTVGNTVNLMSAWGHFVEGSMDLTEQGFYTLVHELVHVWQYQNGGGAYIADSLLRQARASVEHGDRNAAYDWNVVLLRGLPWARWGAEQQAQAGADYFLAIERLEAGEACHTPDALREARRTVTLLGDPIGLLRQGLGAPRLLRR